MHKSFGEHIREERKKLGLTVLAVAEACGTSRSYITLIENGKRLPGRKILPKLAASLNLKTSEIINWYLEAMREKIPLQDD